MRPATRGRKKILLVKEEENGLDDKTKGMKASETEVGEPTAAQTNETTSEPNGSNDLNAAKIKSRYFSPHMTTH